MASYVAVDLIGDAHQHRQQEQLADHLQQDAVHLDDGEEQDGQHQHHKEEAGTTPGVVPGHVPDVLHRQLQPLLVAEDGLMLRPVVGEHPPDVLLLGAQDEVGQKDGDAQHAFQQVAHQVAGDDLLQQATQKGGQ